MKCPLFYIGKTTVFHGEVSDTNNCLQEECAWWDEPTQRCSIKSLGVNFEGIAANMANIVNKMPREV